jgi:hypothetical protein
MRCARLAFILVLVASSIAPAVADSCSDIYGKQGSSLFTASQVRPCVEVEAVAQITLSLLGSTDRGESRLNFYQMKTNCRTGRPLSADPVMWAVEVSTCRVRWCGCFANSGSQRAIYERETRTAPSYYELNDKLLDREHALAERWARQNCTQIALRLHAISSIPLKRTCDQLQ